MRRPGNFTGSIRGPKLPADLKRKLLMVAGVGLLVFVIGGMAFVGWVAKDLPNPDRIIDRTVAESTKIFDRTGEQLLFEIHGTEKRTIVKLEEIPQYLIDATLTAEDRNFYQHRGLSITGILRSYLKNLTTGSRVGGSTLTQQLVKNAILSPEKTYTRKLKEAILAYQIEKRFSKDEILQLYFNEIPYGSTAYGAEAAAQTYFGKSVRDITLAQAALLAALPKAPSFYSPYGSNIDELFGRQQFILNTMVDEGYLVREEADAAIAEKIEFRKRAEAITAPHFVMMVREQLVEKYGELAVEQGGLQVITTLDLYKQKLAEEVIDQLAKRNEDYLATNAALVSIDPKTGQVLALVGSRDFFNEEIDGQVNVADRPRQPGSSFKPIVYAAVFQKGYTPETILYDVVTTFLNYDGRDYEPKNYNLAEHGPVTVRTALAGSLNIPAVKAIYLAGIDKVIDLAEALGYTTLSDRSRFGLSLVLGGGEVTLLEHTNAFGVFAREGEWHPVATLLEVRDKDGTVLEKFEKVEKKVLETQVARQINSILSDNSARAYIFGESNHLTLPNRPVAAKTGTTNDYHDAWTIGYTPSIATGVWVGNSNNDAMKRGADGSVLAAPIWQQFMARLLTGTPVEQFQPPTPTTSDKPVLNGSLAQGIKVKIDKTTGKLATNLTPENLIEEKTYREAHSILYYIDKDDPQGSAPPTRSGQQYDRWEAAVQRWAQENNYITEQPPTDFDDVHTSTNQPKITITSPTKNQTIAGRNFSASVSASAPRGVSRVEYYINNSLIGAATEPPFSLTTTLRDPSVSAGAYQLKVIAYDDVDNAGSDQITLTFQLSDLPPALTWQSPSSNASVASAAFPLQLRAIINEPSFVSQVDLFAKNDEQTIFINTARQFPGGVMTISWAQPPPAGSYELRAEIKYLNGAQVTSKSLPLLIQ